MSYLVIQNMSKKPTKLSCHTLQLENHIYLSIPRLYSYFLKTYDHQTWQADEFRWMTTTNKVTWFFDLVDYLKRLHFYFYKNYSYHTRQGDEKMLGKDDERILFTKSHNPLITWTHQVNLQIKNVISLFLWDLWPPNLKIW